MKSALFLLLLLSSNLIFAQGLIFSSLTSRPDFLKLEKKTDWSGDRHFVHVDDIGQSKVQVNFKSETLTTLEEHLLVSDNVRIYCDGDFSLSNNSQGTQIIALKTVRVCVDEDGWVVAHSVGEKLSPKQIQKTVIQLTKSIKGRGLSGAIFDGSNQKEVRDASSNRSSQYGASGQ